MNYEEITIYDLFNAKELPEEKLKSVELNDKVKHLRQEISKKEPKLKWEKVFKELPENCFQLLNINLKDILKNAWKKYKEVKKYLDTEKYDSEDIFLIPLVEHTIISEHHPKIEISLSGIPIGKIDFDVHLELILIGIILKINQGKIQGVTAGKCKSKGTFSCEGIVLFEDESREFEF